VKSLLKCSTSVAIRSRELACPGEPLLDHSASMIRQGYSSSSAPSGGFCRRSVLDLPFPSTLSRLRWYAYTGPVEVKKEARRFQVDDVLASLLAHGHSRAFTSPWAGRWWLQVLRSGNSRPPGRSPTFIRGLMLVSTIMGWITLLS